MSNSEAQLSESTPNIPLSVSDVNASTSPSKFRWAKVVELGYVEDDGSGSNGDDLESNGPICFHCGASAPSDDKKLSRCSKCQVASYCSRECRVKNWKGGDGKVGHKFSCAAYKRVGEDMMIVFSDDKDEARQDILSRIRFYALPYAIHKSLTSGRGFLFLQSDSSLAVLSLPAPVMSSGRKFPKQRSVLLHWLTMKEFDSEVCMDDFELATVRTELKSAVETYDQKVELPVLMRFRCGHVAVGIAPLVPDYKLCKMLGKDYYGETSGAVQLNIDDM
ncbi:hypothetical protein HJC23_000447 [Cyclotella cryptica]|uniref:MYND-type domain-containing protein n=1 Tax=Cyclotella cryptica TaxID=29204 RepID=A0ABD3Q9R0_9STRA|eukprot:CCRYP_007195-RA/>CCRYP_007195-RA protein AED:0.12 eAED:0.12 QI:326/0.8/0.66/1/0.6/0.5/6/2444/276